MTEVDRPWVPSACTLPTVQQPLRVAELDELLVAGLRAQQRVSARVLRWSLDPQLEVAARELVRRESACCSFFSFTFSSAGDSLLLEVAVPDAYVAVLDGLAARRSAAPGWSQGSASRRAGSGKAPG